MRKFILDLAGPLDPATKKRPQDRRGQHPDKGGGQNAGLLLQRYLCENAAGDKGNPEEKRAVLQAAINAAANSEAKSLYRMAFQRWSAALPTDPPPVDLLAAGRLIVGLGAENVLETGIRLHHAYGMPLIPGSALKGLAAHYCHAVWGPTHKEFGRGDGEFHQLLFGTTEDGGCVIFHDAWLTPDSARPLVLDVMTPHHPRWLDDPPIAPTDFDSPRPVPFLAVTGSFRVAVSWCGPESEKAKSWTKLALDLLCEALKEWGVGGKTTSGYGRMVNPKDDMLASHGKAAGVVGANLPSSSRKAAGAEGANLPSPSGRGAGGEGVPAPATKPGMPRRSGGVMVKFLGAHDKLANAFWVLEEGKKRGLLKYGTPRAPLPDVDSEIEVYRTNDNPSSPEYRWDAPPRPDRPADDRGGRRPRGRR
jgi:CRISPR-associated protein Cmr6